MTHIPNEIVNHIIGYARPLKPKYVHHLTLLCKIVECFKKRGTGDYRLIDYIANERARDRMYKLKTGKYHSLIRQLNHLIFSYNSEKEMDNDFGHTSLGDWFNWHYQDWIYTSGDENYASDESDSDYSSEDD